MIVLFSFHILVSVPKKSSEKRKQNYSSHAKHLNNVDQYNNSNDTQKETMCCLKKKLTIATHQTAELTTKQVDEVEIRRHFNLSNLPCAIDVWRNSHSNQS